MNYEKMLKQPTKQMRLSLPEVLDIIIKEYQKNEKDRHNRKTSKEHLVIKMMMIGEVAFIAESLQMAKEFKSINQINQSYKSTKMADQNPVETPQEEIQLTEEELVTKQIILEKDQMIAKLEKEKASLTNRSLAVHQKNEMLMSSEVIQQKMAMLEYEDKLMESQLKIAKRFSDSKAFPTASPEQIYTLIKAGEEMGLKPIVALNLLYVVNGHINPYGDKMLGYILQQGYRVEYVNEDETVVTVRIYKLDFDGNVIEEYIETASIQDQIIKKSMVKGAASFALKNKLRFHAIRMIASFHLPHLFMGCGDNFSPDFESWKEGETMKIKDESGNTIQLVDDLDLKSQIESAPDLETLELIELNNKSIIIKSVILVSAVGARKKFLQSQNQ